MQPDLFGPDPAAEKPQTGREEETRAHLHRQLVRLGDMIGDGLADEPGGNWIRQDYRRVAKALGYEFPKRRSNTQGIDVAVARYIDANRCECGGLFKQTRSGALRIYCASCTVRFKLKTKKGRG